MAELQYFFDLGNTRLKLWAIQGERVLAELALPHAADPAILLRAPLSGFSAQPARVLGASVLSAEQNLLFAQELARQWQCVPEFAKVSAERSGVRCAYAEPQRLGIDRWLGLLAVADGQQDYVVVDAGTAITIDLVTRDREHLGGFILPGLDMMANALMQGTRQIQVRGHVPFLLAPGRSTESAVGNGALLAAVGAIERVARLVADGGHAPMLVVTGGAAAVLLPHLERAAVEEPNLLLKGMMRYFNQQ